jgi:RHS repeat-associated protein
MKNYEQRMHENGIGDVFGYDAVYRLTSAKFNVPDPTAANPTDFEREWNIFLDHLDNITRIDETKNGETSQITTEIPLDSDFLKLNQYSRFDQWGLTYDKNGNLTQKSTQKMYHDYRNRMVRATEGTTSTTENKYDALGRRLQKIVTTGSQTKTDNYYYAGHQLVEVRDGSDQVRRQFIYGNGIDEVVRMDVYNGSTITPYYFHRNEIGSTTAVTDANGNVVERYKYGLYGMPIFMDAAGNVIPKSAIGNNILFQGREYEPETNFYYFRARHLDPIMGRFLQTDPMGYADSMNLYQAFNMNPVNFIDPMGLDKGTTEDVRWVLSQPGIETGGEFLERDFNNFLSNFKSKESVLQYSAWWLDKYGIYVPGLGAGTKMGTAVTGTTVSGYEINEVERSNRLLWGGFEFAFLWTANSLEPKPVTVQNEQPIRSNSTQSKNQVQINKDIGDSFDEYVAGTKLKNLDEMGQLARQEKLPTPHITGKNYVKPDYTIYNKNFEVAAYADAKAISSGHIPLDSQAKGFVDWASNTVSKKLIYYVSESCGFSRELIDYATSKGVKLIQVLVE